MNINIKVKGLDKLTKGLNKFPKEFKRELKIAMKTSALLIEAKTKPLVPVFTGYLRQHTIAVRSSFTPYRAVVGSFTDYAVAVHEGFAYHRIGERKFLEKGTKMSEPLIEILFNSAIEKALMKSIY